MSDQAEQPATTDMRKPIDRASEALNAGRHDEADAIASEMLRLDPEAHGEHGPPALAVRGYVAVARQDIPRAVELFERALARRPEPLWYALLADLYRSLHRLDDAHRHAMSGVRSAERHERARPLASLARVMNERDDHEGAAEAYLGLLAIEPDNAAGHFGLSETLLLRGEFLPGWSEYSWRFRIPGYRSNMPEIQGAEWNGMRLPSGRLLVVAEQGYGDTFQFSRFLTEASTRVKELVLACGDDLAGLMSQIPGVSRCLSDWSEIPPFSAYCYITSLGGVLAVDETKISGARYLSADRSLAADWSRNLNDRGPGMARIGLFWSGRAAHANNARRSLDFAQLTPIREAAKGALLVSLQRERSQAEAWRLAELGIVDAAPQLGSFADTAALISELDLVISVDSAVIHLAGALGKTAWLMTPKPADWRWGYEGDDTRWYDSVRLFRQPRAGDWDGVIGRIASLLPDFIAGDRSAS